MLNLNLSKQSVKFIKKLPSKQHRQVVNKVLELLTDPSPSDSKKLVGYPFHRVDIGEYRIIYRKEENLIKVTLIEKRNDDAVYKLLKNKH